MADHDLPSSAYRDPFRVIEQREAQTCLGCIFEFRMTTGAPRMVCGRNKEHGKRCKLYEPRPEAA